MLGRAGLGSSLTDSLAQVLSGQSVVKTRNDVNLDASGSTIGAIVVAGAALVAASYFFGGHRKTKRRKARRRK